MHIPPKDIPGLKYRHFCQFEDAIWQRHDQAKNQSGTVSISG